MSKLNNDNFELTSNELDQVSGGSIISWLVGLYEAAQAKAVMDAIHQPLVSPPKMTLHMR